MIWQNEFNLTIWQFGLANRFAKWTKIVAPVFWHKDLAGAQLWFQEVWWRARDCLLGHSTQMVSHHKFSLVTIALGMTE
jgi:hypothetical protein